MTNHDRSVAADVQRHQIQLLDKASAYWYACGYNDHRKADDPYVDAAAFAEAWVSINRLPSHPSLQDAFTSFERQAFIDRLTGRAPAQEVKDDLAERNLAERINWLHCLVQELEDHKVELPMGDYTDVYGIIEEAREAL